MNGGPSGFHNAPVTKTVVIATALFTIASGVRGYSFKLGLAYQDIFEQLRIWRLICSVITFSSMPELIFGACLLYYFRVFERQIGSNKYAVFVTFSVLVPLLFQILALGYLKDFVGKLTPGHMVSYLHLLFPFSLISPSRRGSHIISAPVQQVIYICGGSPGKQSLVPGLWGILAGCFYCFNTFGILVDSRAEDVVQYQQWLMTLKITKFPDAVTSIVSRVALPSLRSSSQNLSSNDIVERLPSYSNHQSGLNQVEETVPMLPPPSEASATTLISMGFDRDSAMQALMLTGNDLNTATNILLEAQSHYHQKNSIQEDSFPLCR